MKSYLRIIATICCALPLAGCNWFGGNGTDSPPSAEINFPSRMGHTPADMLSVSGTANDDRAVSSVVVNGTVANSTDNFQTWTANVPLSFGVNSISIDVVDFGGNRVTRADEVVVERRKEIRRPFGFEIHASSNTLYYIDLDLQKIMTFDLSTGVVAEFADLAQFQPTSGNGRPPLDLALDLPNNRVFLTVRDVAAVGAATIGIWSYDMLTESWSAFSDAVIDPASVFVNPSDVILDLANSRLLVVDFDFDAVVAVSLATGAQSILSSNTIPGAIRVQLDEPIDAALDSLGNRLLLVDRGADAVLSIDLTTGVKTVVTGPAVGSGPALNQPLSIAYDAANNRALVFDRSGTRGVIAVDLATGVRTIFAGSFDDPNGLWLSDVRALGINGGELIAFDNNFDHALGFDLSTGARRVVTNNGFPRGDSPPSFESLTKVGNYLYGHNYSSIGRIGADNSVEILAGDPLGGANGLNIIDSVVNETGSTAYVVSSVFQNNVVEYFVEEIDLSDGTATILSDNTTPNTDNPIMRVHDLVYDAANERLLLLEDDRILQIDTASGARVAIVDDPSLPYDDPRRMALDANNNRLLVTDDDYDHFIAVDTTTGAKSVFSNSPVPGENIVERPSSVTVTDSGSIWMMDVEDRLLSVDPQSGARAMQFDVTTLDISYPTAWTELAGGDGVIYIKAYSGILEFDPVTREFVTIFSTPQSSSGNNT